MNDTKIEWCDMTWNPVTGCLHGCKYCYANKIANRFGKVGGNKSILRVSHNPKYPGIWEQEEKPKNPYPHKFQPTLHKYRLDELVKKIKPQKIFICSMADLFGEWVPDEWIQQVFEACWQAKQHKYIFLTKNPKRYKEVVPQWKSHYGELQNMWFGTTITSNNDIQRAFDLLNSTTKSINKFISIEPLHGDINLNEHELLLSDYKNKVTIGNYVDWVIVGAQTGLGAKPTKKEWVQNIIDQCRTAKVPVFIKNNLDWHEKIQELPV